MAGTSPPDGVSPPFVLIIYNPNRVKARRCSFYLFGGAERDKNDGGGTDQDRDDGKIDDRREQDNALEEKTESGATGLEEADCQTKSFPNQPKTLTSGDIERNLPGQTNVASLDQSKERSEAEGLADAGEHPRSSFHQRDLCGVCLLSLVRVHIPTLFHLQCALGAGAVHRKA